MEHLKQQLKHTDLMPKKPTTPPPANGIEAAKRRAESPEFRPTHEHSGRRATVLAAAVIVPLLAITGAGIYAVTQLGEPRTTIQPATGTSPTSPTGAPTFNSDGTYTFQGHDITFVDTSPASGHVLAILDHPQPPTGDNPSTIIFQGDPNWRYSAEVSSDVTSVNSLDEFISSGRLLRVWRSKYEREPHPGASVSAAGWSLLAAGRESEDSKIQRMWTRSDRSQRLFNYASYTLIDPYESPQTRRDALATLTRLGAKVRPVSHDNRLALSITLSPALSPSSSSSADEVDGALLLDPGTGIAIDGQYKITRKLDAVPKSITGAFEEALRTNDGRCSTAGPVTTCVINP